MLNFTEIIQLIDHIFTMLIPVPMLFVLGCAFTGFHKKTPRRRLLYRVCQALIILFLIRCFLDQFIFTDVNYQRFTSSGLFPLFKALFY